MFASRRTTSLAFSMPKFKAGRSYVPLQVPTVGPAPPLYVIPESQTLRKLISEADENKRKILHGKRGVERRSVLDFFRLRLGYSSNAIEGNKLSEADVLQFIRCGTTVSGKTVGDYLAVEAHDEAVQYLFQDSRNREEPLTRNTFSELHHIVQSRSVKPEDPTPGEFKKDLNFAMRVDTELKERVAFLFVHPQEVEDQIAELIGWIGQHEKQLHPIQLAAVGHYNFVRINPFPVGNGIVGRLFMNLIFLRNNFNPAVIEPSERQNYMSYLHQSDKGDLLPMAEFIGSSLISTQRLLLSLGLFDK